MVVVVTRVQGAKGKVKVEGVLNVVYYRQLCLWQVK